MRQVLFLTPAVVLMAGCGVSVHYTTGTSTTSAVKPPTGDRTFSSAGMAVHFRYPATFASGTINSVGRELEHKKSVSRAALEVGSGGYDLLIVTRYARIMPPVTARNVHAQKPYYDRALSKIFAHRMVASVSRVGGLPALRYPDAPTPGVPVKATTRATFVFVGRDEYELQCQWTSAERTAVTAACGKMLRTLHT